MWRVELPNAFRCGTTFSSGQWRKLQGWWKGESGWRGNVKFYSAFQQRECVDEARCMNPSPCCLVTTVVFVARLHAFSFPRPEKESVMGLIQVWAGGNLMVHAKACPSFFVCCWWSSSSPLYPSLHSFSSPSALPPGLEVGSVFPFCHSHPLCLVGPQPLSV